MTDETFSPYTDCNHSELYQICSELGLPVQPWWSNQSLQQAIMGDPTGPQNITSRYRLALMQFILDHWQTLSVQLACPAKSGNLLSCFNCLDTQVVACLVDNPAAHLEVERAMTETWQPDLQGIPRTVEGIMSLTGPKRYNLALQLKLVPATGPTATAFFNLGLDEQARQILLALTEYDKHPNAPAPTPDQIPPVPMGNVKMDQMNLPLQPPLPQQPNPQQPQYQPPPQPQYQPPPQQYQQPQYQPPPQQQQQQQQYQPPQQQYQQQQYQPPPPPQQYQQAPQPPQGGYQPAQPQGGWPMQVMPASPAPQPQQGPPAGFPGAGFPGGFPVMSNPLGTPPPPPPQEAPAAPAEEEQEEAEPDTNIGILVGALQRLSRQLETFEAQQIGLLNNIYRLTELSLLIQEANGALLSGLHVHAHNGDAASAATNALNSFEGYRNFLRQLTAATPPKA